MITNGDAERHTRTQSTRRSASPAIDAALGGDDVMEQIAKLGQLRDAALLAEEQFGAKKADLLGRLWPIRASARP